MKNLTYQLWLLAVFVFVFSSCTKENLEELDTAQLVSELAPVDYSSIELDVLDLVNGYREANDLPLLNFLDEISQQAQAHNLHMIEAGEVCHDDFPVRYSFLARNINAKAVSENVAYGYRTAEAVVNAWTNSDGHRENMDGDFTHFGISVEGDENGRLYYTNIFVKK